MDGEEEEKWDNAAAFMQAPQHVEVGRRCSTDPGDRLCKVMFVGVLPPPMPGGYWVGVMYDAKVGKNDGSLNGKCYFRCPPGHGGFLRPDKVKDIPEQRAADEAAVRSAARRRTPTRHPLQATSARTRMMRRPC